MVDAIAHPEQLLQVDAAPDDLAQVKTKLEHFYLDQVFGQPKDEPNDDQIKLLLGDPNQHQINAPFVDAITLPAAST